MKQRELNLTLWEAVAKGNPDKVRKAISGGAEVNAIGDPNSAPAAIAGETPLRAAVSLAAHNIQEPTIALFEAFREISHLTEQDNPRKKRKHYLNIIRFLIRAGADIEKRCYGSTPLRVACIHNDLEVAEILLASGANPNADIYSPMSRAAKRAGQNVLPGYYGTILHEIVSKGYEGATALLIKAGADPHRLDNRGRTAFAIARAKGGGPILKMLQKGKAIELVRANHSTGRANEN